MKKIIIDREEGVAEVIDEILNEPDPEVTLVIPKSSALGRTVSNFHLLKREADAAGKTVVIESVDEAILAFAKESNLESSHPLWRGVRSQGVVGGISDIVPKSRRPAAATSSSKKKIEPPKEDEDEEVVMEVTEEEGEVEMEEEEERPVEKKTDFFGRRNRNEDTFNNDDDDDDDSPRRRGISGKVWATIAVVIVLVLGGAYIAGAYFNHATISITFKKTAWTWQGALTADKSVPSDDFSGGTIAGQVFTSNKNVTETFKASSQSAVSLKAQGTITIYNDYSTSPQQLVATTRFLTPDGKIFRITQDVTVPGATKASDGTLTPSSVNAPIAADQPGPDYNIGPVAKLTIPGFAGKPQASGFYGTINASTTGGFTGTRGVPTAADITAAKASTTAALQASLQGGFSGSYPNNFKILDGATDIQVGTLTVNTTTDDQGNFTVFSSATLSAIGFDESALKNDLLAQAQGQYPSSTFHDITLNYTNVQANFTKGQVAFSVSAQGNLEPAFMPVVFEQDILGKNVSEARNTIAALTQLSSGEISVWPLWLGTIPADPAKVKINVD
ncbi:MAG: hypothetical protein P4L67_03945 [Candidatus Pacebacteria bacterium]|nr:hypothetical protein [Candidatus Paceibacterota bacterium]